MIVERPGRFDVDIILAEFLSRNKSPPPNIKAPPHNIKTDFRGFGFNVRGVVGSFGYESD